MEFFICLIFLVLEDEILTVEPPLSISQTVDDIPTKEANLLTYKQLISRNKLLEYSNNSHTAVYLHSHLARTELRQGILWCINLYKTSRLDKGKGRNVYF